RGDATGRSGRSPRPGARAVPAPHPRVAGPPATHRAGGSASWPATQSSHPAGRAAVARVGSGSETGRSGVADRYPAGLRELQYVAGACPIDVLKLAKTGRRSEEHTFELQSRRDLVCRLLLEKKKKRRDGEN